MFGGDIYAALVEGLRALFLIVVPVTIAVMLAGALAGVLQTSTAVVDTAIGYAARLLA
jgi:type III secretory pathway component EscS